MHELSVALSIVDIAEEEAARQGGAAVLAVHIRLGPLAGVIKAALLSAYELACEGSSLAGSRLVVEDVPVVMFCPQCAGERPVTSLQCLCCARCGTPAVDVVRGRELEIKALEFET